MSRKCINQRRRHSHMEFVLVFSVLLRDVVFFAGVLECLFRQILMAQYCFQDEETQTTEII